MDEMHVTVFGGTGFLGRWIVDALRRRGWRVRIAVRRPERADDLVAKEGIDVCTADVRDDRSVRAALDGAGAAVNAVGLYVERADARFSDIHVAGAERIARNAALAGTARLVHISGIGVDAASPSPYIRARAEGEDAVRSAFPDATILRPSVIFGPGDGFFTTFAKTVRRAPVVPLFGAGRTAVQPIYAGDVAEAVCAASARGDAKGRVYEIGGPDRLTYLQALRLVMEQTERWRPVMPVPFALWDLLARLLSVLPNPPITRDMIALVSQDNIADDAMPGLDELGVQPRSAREILPSYIR